MNARLRLPALVGAIAVLALSCAAEEPSRAAFSGDISRGNPTTSVDAAAEPSTSPPDPTPLDPARAAELQAELDAVPPGCEVLSTKNCLLPFPSDAHTVDDPSSATFKRVNLPQGQLANTAGDPIDPTEWNRNDGWSPSTPILVFVPGLDPEATRLPRQDEIGLSVTEASATVLVDLTTGNLVPHWAEMDERAADPDDRLLIIRPASSLRETHRFAVGLRHMVGTDGEELAAPIAFSVFRDNNTVDDPRITDRQREFNGVFAQMASAGVDRSELYLAWYFTVASADSLAGRLLTMREDAYGNLAGGAPPFRVTGTSTDDLEPGIAKVVTGTYRVPLYLSGDGGPGSRMTFDPVAPSVPVSRSTFDARFDCVVPESAVADGEAIPVVYGHGLLGGRDEVSSSDVQHTAAELNAVYCATDWIGMAEEDTAWAVQVLGDLSLFPSIPDRLQQGILNTLLLARLMVDQDGLSSDPEFSDGSGATMLNTEEAYFDGNSQGAIMGGAATAVAVDWTKASLGVGGMNYSTLLNRSVDFDEYFAIMRAAYPDPLEQQILFGLIQMLWDRGETAGYVQHLTTRTYDRTPPKQVLMSVAFGDHQVATVTADNIARTLRIPIYEPALPSDVAPYVGVDADRAAQDRSFFRLDPIRLFPHNGSALYYWYSGTLPPPMGNITPTESSLYLEDCQGAAAEEDVACLDPHGDVRRQPRVIEQKKAFFTPEGTIENVCRDRPCRAKPRDEFDY